MRTITVTPAGRRRYLEILANYLLRNRQVIDEHHWWLNTREPGDVAFLHRLVDQYPKFFKIVSRPMRGSDLIGYSIWPYLRGSDAADALYIRLDDDICFVEDGAIAAMRDFRLAHREPFLVLGNVVNNAICTHLHQAAGLTPLEWGRIGQECMDEIGWRSGEFAARLHQRFLKEIVRGRLAPWKNAEMPFDGVRRFSINAISWFGADMAAVPEGPTAPIDEEPFVTIDMPRRLERPNVICPEALFGHYAFYTQRKYLETVTPEILLRYKRISESADMSEAYDLPLSAATRIGVLKVFGALRQAVRHSTSEAKALVKRTKQWWRGKAA